MRLRLPLVFPVLLFLLFGCSESTFEEYYYDLETLRGTKYYVFECQGDRNDVYYLKLDYDQKKKQLTSESIDNAFNVYAHSVENITSKGVTLKSCTLYTNDFEIRTKVIDKDIFLWSPDVASYNYSLEYDIEKLGFLYGVTRSFIGKEPVSFMGRQEEAIKFEDITEYHYKMTREDLFPSVQYSYYVKGVGLVKEVLVMESGEKKTYVLTKILSAREFKALKRRNKN